MLESPRGDYIEDIKRWREDMNFIFEWQYNIKFIYSSHRVMFFLLYTCRLKDVDKIIQGNYQHYVIDELTCEIMENKPLVFMNFSSGIFSSKILMSI